MSPSAQCVINPDKRIDIVSTHDQLLGGDDGQIFMGAIFPADKAYNISLAAEARKIAQTLAEKGALGRFAVDFISVKDEAMARGSIMPSRSICEKAARHIPF